MGCAAGKPLIGPASRPLNVLYWACEDDTDELHRRMVAIGGSLGVSLGDLAGKLHVDARLGLDNTILATAYGRPAWTPRVEVLRQQLNDLHIDLLILDNLAHVFAASENDRASVTMFAAGLCGLILDRPWCPMLIGHVAKSQGSEYAGSTAWENAVRMRWFLGKNMPDAQEDDEQSESDMRILAKRKSNYSSDDVIRLRVGDRRFHIEEQTDEGTVIGALREQNVRKVVIDAIRTLRARNIDSSEQYSRAYLPAQMVQFGLTNGHGKKDLERAMRQLLMSGEIRREVVGKKANRMPREGLIVVNDATQ
jgi:RecA-family ATPase